MLNTQKITSTFKMAVICTKQRHLCLILYDANLSLNCLLQSIIINAVSFGISKANKAKENEQ